MSHRPNTRASRLQTGLAILLLGMLTGTSATAAGEVLSVDAYRAQESTAELIYLDFWASWCAPCRQSFPWMNRMAQKYVSSGLQVVAVNLDTQKAAAMRFLQELPAQFDVVLDPAAELATQFAVPAMPTSYLLAPDGTVLHQHRGFRAADTASLEARIQQFLAPSALDLKQGKPE